jgi:hypothetical protein
MMTENRIFRGGYLHWLVLAIGILAVPSVHAQAASASGASGSPSAPVAAKPVQVEWVYRIRYGFHDEWFRIFKKYQLAILERQKQLGYVTDYTVYAPSLHTSEDARWDYRIIITRASGDPPPWLSEDEIAKQLLPDQESFRREENRRWELTANHWDLPIHVVHPDAAE